MTLKAVLQPLGDWFLEVSKVAKDSVDVALESGHLKDALKDFGTLGGVAGALFKLGCRVIPDPTPEQKIAQKLNRAFVQSLDSSFKKSPGLVGTDTWKTYLRERGDEAAAKQLSKQFTWLSIFGPQGIRTSRSWPLVCDLADVGRRWVAEAAAREGNISYDRQLEIDAVRGRLADDLAAAVEKLLTEPDIQKAWQLAVTGSGRRALELLADELSLFEEYRLFGEVPQDQIYVPPTLKQVDFRHAPPDVDWGKVPAEKGTESLCRLLQEGPRLVVIVGEMGVGKSCLMRVLTAAQARHYLLEKDRAPVFVRWRDVYRETNLREAIAGQLKAEYGLPFDDLPRQERLVYFLDGFDEMSSHDPTVVWTHFERLAKLVDLGHTVLVAMRSTVVTPGLKGAWQEKKSLVVQIQRFTQDDVNDWASRWRQSIGAQGLTGDRLRQIAGEEVAQNPLLLYMLARHVLPRADLKGGLSRAEVFRTFVDDTIKGKLRASGERFDLPADFADNYRLLLQEIAYLASWPKSNGKCSEDLLRERLDAEVMKRLHFANVRTPFVLHFFDPGISNRGEFEFQPEGFRQYLLAEWCVRVQLEALLDEDEGAHPFARRQKDAMDALAQFPLREEERYLLDDLYAALNRLLATPGELAKRLRVFGIHKDSKECVSLLRKLANRLLRHAHTPPDHRWKDEKVGVPAGQEVAAAFDSLRILVNYWDQCLIGTFALQRRSEGEAPGGSPRQGVPLGQFLRARSVVRGFSYRSDLRLVRSNLSGVDLRGTFLARENLSGADLRGAYLSEANLTEVGLSEADLRGADLTFAILSWADLSGADLSGAMVWDANLSWANLSRANLGGAELSGANLHEANLNGADLSDARLHEAYLSEANLNGADLHEADVTGADLFEAMLDPDQLKMTIGNPKRLPDGTRPNASDEEPS